MIPLCIEDLRFQWEVTLLLHHTIVELIKSIENHTLSKMRCQSLTKVISNHFVTQAKIMSEENVWYFCRRSFVKGTIKVCEPTKVFTILKIVSGNVGSCSIALFFKNLNRAVASRTRQEFAGS